MKAIPDLPNNDDGTSFNRRVDLIITDKPPHKVDLLKEAKSALKSKWKEKLSDNDCIITDDMKNALPTDNIEQWGCID